MQRNAFIVVLAAGALLGCAGVEGQQVSIVRRHAALWTCHGHMWLENSHIYCKDWRTKELAKTTLDGQQVFSHLDTPPVGGSTHIVAVAEDSDGNLYAVDGAHVHEYSPTGKYEKTISPRIHMSDELVVVDPEHIFVAGHVPFKQTGTGASLFLVNSAGVEKSFSTPFFPEKTGLEGLMVNMPSMLAMDRKKQVLYQLSPNLYEIRAFTLSGEPIGTIVPPKQYLTRPPQIVHYPNGGVGIGPSDTLDDLAVLPNGGLAVSGGRLDSSTTQASNTNVSYTRFLDLYDAAGNFQRRILEPDLRLEGAPFRSIDHRTGLAYYGKSGIGLETEVAMPVSQAKR